MRRLRNIQSSEFYSRLVMRPLSIAIMWVVADWKWLTPNLLTTAANITKLVGAAMLAFDHHGHDWAAAIWLQVGLLFDHLDGTLARYRQTGSAFGAFYDKVSDAVTWMLISAALGWAAFKDTGDIRLPIAAMAAAYCMLTLGYMKWIVAAAQKKSPATPPEDPPARTLGQWVTWFGSSLLRAAMFEEVDLFLWLGIGLVIGRLDWTIWMLLASQMVQLGIMIVKRGLQIAAIDARR